MSVVYFIKVEGKDTFKIGYTDSDAHQRLAAIQTYCPFPVSVYGVIETDEPRQLEQTIHRQFSDSKTSGEWFNIPVETINGLLIGHQDGKLVPCRTVEIDMNVCPHCGQKMPEQNGAVVKTISKPEVRKTRRGRGPRNDPGNPNAPKCKLPGCNNPLTGNNKVGCSDAHRQKVYRLIKAGKLEKTW